MRECSLISQASDSAEQKRNLSLQDEMPEDRHNDEKERQYVSKTIKDQSIRR